MADAVQEIFVDVIDDPAAPMRSELDRDALWELAESIKQNGLINPITVRRRGDRYEVVAGHRRFSASKIAGVVKIAAVVRDLDDDATMSVRAHENLFRADVDPVDMALSIARWMEEKGGTIDDAAKLMNHTRQWVEDRLIILEMPDYLVVALKEEKISLAAAKWLNKIGDEWTRTEYTKYAIRDGVTAKVAEYWFHQWEVQQVESNSEWGKGNPNFPPVPPPEPPVDCVRCGRPAALGERHAVIVHRQCPEDDGNSV